MDETYSISQLAKEFDITTRSIRHYEDIGLVSPSRKGKTRIYDRKDRIRLKLTLRGKRLGFPLAEIKELLDMYDTSNLNKNRQLLATIAKIEQKNSELEQQLLDIREIQDELDLAEVRCRTAIEKNSRNNRRKKLSSEK
jgi:DNA-binding transcriptional MerR regulator